MSQNALEPIGFDPNTASVTAANIYVGFVMGYFGVFGLLSAFASLNAFKHRDEIYDKTHNATIVFGALTFNIFALIGGWLNYRYRVSKYKMKPVKE